MKEASPERLEKQTGEDRQERTARELIELLNELRVRAESICTYDHGTKVDVTVTSALAAAGRRSSAVTAAKRSRLITAPSSRTSCRP